MKTKFLLLGMAFTISPCGKSVEDHLYDRDKYQKKFYGKALWVKNLDYNLNLTLRLINDHL